MSWLRSSPLRQSLTRSGPGSGPNGGSGRHQRSIDAATDCDPRACYDSFCKHWQQAYEIILRAEPNKPPSHDDVLGVVSHLDYMVTLLLVELHHCNKISLPGSNQTPHAPCLEFLLSENLLDKLYEWGTTTGRYANAVRLEQLKLYELLVSHSRHQLLVHEPFLRPLLKILASSQGEIFPPDVEKRLVILLNQLCVVLMQNVHLLDLFFFSSSQQYGQGSTNFVIFSLLIPYVHREGSLGHQARDALLLCMALSQKNSNVGTYIAKYSSMCPLLVTGLGGLYSRLPNSIEINSIDWHRITPDDVTEIPELTLFMNSLEFCNAVVQVAHNLIKQQLLDFMYQGFIVPVLGPAVLQTNTESQISAMAYLDLILRSVTEPGLLRGFVKFLLDEEKFDGQRILDVLIERLNSTDPNLCMVTLSVFDTILGLHCEDIMLELLLKFLLPGKHIPISCRHKVNRIDPYVNTVDFFLDLTPDVMKQSSNISRLRRFESAQTSQQGSSPTVQTPNVSKTIGANWNHYGLHTGDSLYSNYHAYLFDAHHKISLCRTACSQWTNLYRYQKWPPKRTNGQTLEKIIEMVRNFFTEFSQINISEAQMYDCDKNKYDSLQSIGESSGYESFKWRPDEELENASGVGNILPNTSGGDGFDDSQRKIEPIWTLSNRKDQSYIDLDFSEDLFAQGTVSLGPFLNAIWGKLQTFTSNSLYVNLHLTGLITRLAWYPLPLIHSLILRPDIITTSDTPSFHQVLRILKQQIDAELPVTEDSLEIIDVARSFLIDREFRLVNARKNAIESSKNPGKNGVSYNQTTYANISATTPPQLTPSSSYDPFKRNDTKRKSFSQSITSMFRRPSGGVLCGDLDDFRSCDDVFDAIGDILREISSEKSENFIRDICEQFFKIMKPPKETTKQKMLSAPVNIAQMAADMENNATDMKSIWVVNRDLSNKVDSKKLEKAEAKLQQKLEKRENTSKAPVVPILQSATASQVINKKDNKLNNKGLNRSMDIRIENFDLAFGEKVLLKNADLVLSFGRRYGLVGRNGLGKTTLLRMISDRQLKIPPHISVLHVEQEVVGDDTAALDSVLECDTVRNELLAREKELLAVVNEGMANMTISEELSQIYAQLQNIEADKAVSRASIILRGLGFSPDMQARPTKSFSGGWRMRLALARALFSKPDLLLLDEPTNMLDIKAIIWLENYLQNWPTTLLVVSHDRNFLDTVPTDIIHLHSFRLDTYKGNYEQFDKTKTEKLKAQRREYEAQMAYRAHVQEFIDRFRYNANRASSVQSKIKMLEKLPELKPIEKDVEVKLKFPEVEPLNPPVLSLNEISFHYNDTNKIFTNVSLNANSESRICIVGENGAGKTTLLKLVTGKLTPTAGIINMHRGLRIGYFAQHHVDNLDMNLTCVGILQAEFPGKSDEEYRRQLGSFGISGNLALQSVGSLSGGQKSRVAFAKMCMANPNFIILDEPTNHLDIETICALGKAINNFKGGVILVSHDERLIRVVCKELWVCGNGNVQAMEGGINQYKQEVLREIEMAAK